MRAVEENGLGVIWFNPSTNQYGFGTWKVFRDLSKNKGIDLEIIYETKRLTAKLAEKIVKELNAARFENDARHPRAA